MSMAEFTGGANPFNGVASGGYSAPTLADMDNDGKLDLILGEIDGALLLYKNVGSAGAPAFSEVTGAGSPFDGIDVGDRSVPALGDLDGDGDDVRYIVLFTASIFPNVFNYNHP